MAYGDYGQNAPSCDPLTESNYVLILALCKGVKTPSFTFYNHTRLYLTLKQSFQVKQVSCPMTPSPIVSGSY